MAEPLDPRLLAQALMQGQVPDAQDYMMPGGNLGPSASGRANPSWGPLDYMGMGMGGIGGAALGGGMGQALSRMGASIANAGPATSVHNIGLHNMLTRIPAAFGGVGGARTGLGIADDIRNQRAMPPMGPYSPQVPQEYAAPAYDDGTMYGGQMPPRR